MGKVKVKKSDVWIDMTPMSDVMVLLLTFFMMTSTFVKNEAVKVMTPMSVSEIKVPETNVLTVLVDKEGKVFVGLDTPQKQEALLSDMAAKYGISLTGQQLENGRGSANIGVAMKDLSEFLNQPNGFYARSAAKPKKAAETAPASPQPKAATEAQEPKETPAPEPQPAKAPEPKAEEPAPSTE